MERQGFIDQLKALSIFLIVYGHNDTTSIFSEYLTAFRIPLFFIVSGYLSKDKGNLDLLPYLKKMALRLLTPYFLISLFLYLVWFFIGRHLKFGGDDHDPIKNFIGIFYAQGGADYMIWGLPMWFLPALFCVSIIDFFVSKLPFQYKVVPALALPVLGMLISGFLGFQLPWSLDIAMVVYLFYFFGIYIRKVDIAGVIKGTEILVFIISLIIFVVGTGFNHPVNFYYASFGLIPLMFFNGISGFMACFAVFKILPTFNSIKWVGKNTLPILAFHFLAMSFMQGLAFLIFGYKFEFTVFVSFVYSVLQILILVPVILFMNRFTPILVGIPKQTKPANLIDGEVRSILISVNTKRNTTQN